MSNQTTDDAAATEGALKSEVRDGMRIDWDVPIALSDGLVLRADVYRPDSSESFPAIVSCGPYAKGQTFAAGYGHAWKQLVANHPDAIEGSSTRYTAWELLDPDQWVPQGYAIVRVDSRGAGRSPGYVDVWSPQETRDFYDAVEWVADQSWCSGKVGLSGISYFAKNQWQVAALRPPHLAAICPWEGSNDFYREMTHHGGMHSAFLAGWWRRMETIQHGVGTRGVRNAESGLLVAGDEDLSDDQLKANRVDLPAELVAHKFDDQWHQDRTARVEDITVPLLSCANWGGLGQHQRGNIAAWQNAGSQQKWLEVHGGTHWAGYYTEYGRKLQRRFFDWFLRGEGDWLTQPLVSLNIRNVDETFELRGEQEWPLQRTNWKHKFLDVAAGALTDEAPAVENQCTYRALGEGVTLYTEPLDEETEFTGPLAAKLWVSSSTSDADLFLTVRAFAPDGIEVLFQGANDPRTPLSQGWLRASHRKLDEKRSQPWAPFHPHDEEEPLIPGTVYELDIEVWATCIVLPAGYRLALTIQGRDFDHGLEPASLMGFDMRGAGPFQHVDPVDRPGSVFDNELTLYSGGDRPSYLLVPEIPPRARGGTDSRK
jgi:predicted acyl esterase